MRKTQQCSWKALGLLLFLPCYDDNAVVNGFVSPLGNTFLPNSVVVGRPLFAEGFGSSSSSSPESKSGKVFQNKTYGSAARPSRSVDIIDTEEAMSSFFSTNNEWNSLFRSFVSTSSAPARSVLANDDGDETEFGTPIRFDDDDDDDDSSEEEGGGGGNQNNVPWKRLNEIPTKEEELSVLSSFLDSMQQSLVEIPVDESTKDDASDVHFIEEGRRILVVSRFHVLMAKGRSRMEQNEELFTTCWSEMAALKRAGEKDTGSLILLPDYDILDLERFTEMNLQQPLQWMGIDRDLFEVASLKRGSPAIRILHKLSDIPEVEGGVVESMS